MDAFVPAASVRDAVSVLALSFKESALASDGEPTTAEVLAALIALSMGDFIHGCATRAFKRIQRSITRRLEEVRKLVLSP